MFGGMLGKGFSQAWIINREEYSSTLANTRKIRRCPSLELPSSLQRERIPLCIGEFAYGLMLTTSTCSAFHSPQTAPHDALSMDVNSHHRTLKSQCGRASQPLLLDRHCLCLTPSACVGLSVSELSTNSLDFITYLYKLVKFIISDIKH
jgi:hypothetical protein